MLLIQKNSKLSEILRIQTVHSTQKIKFPAVLTSAFCRLIASLPHPHWSCRTIYCPHFIVSPTKKTNAELPIKHLHIALNLLAAELDKRDYQDAEEIHRNLSFDLVNHGNKTQHYNVQVIVTQNSYSHILRVLPPVILSAYFTVAASKTISEGGFGTHKYTCANKAVGP